ncbi:S8 family peptidase [Mucilaginibacter myungsuensis]|uniref:S8 family peptidase n=1 Tax=Mucilaginibacter myungsuensis TaxID=649104 RepID=A0A929KTK7_9SPHI|nr:S8 family peptidase [Mucilaginibacter myungsuensis]MBE9661299.1 S8 family peptidase [Mucilaginibacter myungsuensis]MDN3597442.1 S8 family peptidase [Mucilaginibacter myungsuensis]
MNITKYAAGMALSAALFASINVNAQFVPAPPPKPSPQNWHALDLTTDGYYGVSLAKAYALLKGKKSKPVTVAVIDSGVDTLQKDLKSIFWVNTKEIPGNGIDDDKNGYIDDIHGWNFLGGPGGQCDHNETTEEVREYNRLKGKYLGANTSTTADPKEEAYWQQVRTTYETTVNKSREELQDLKPYMNILVGTSGFIKRELKLKPSDSFTMMDLGRITTPNDTVRECKNAWMSVFQQQGVEKSNADIIKGLSEYITKLSNDVNPDLEARKRIVGDDPNNWEDKKYGSNQLKFPDAQHGTMVAGFIGAMRGNGYGIDGVADNVRIMAIKAVPNGDEYDKDIAYAIRYAVDNGAKIVNMSFGKKLSPHKDWVDAAYKYAAEHDVLLISAAGNDNQDVDSKADYPNDTFADGSAADADNVINVGASGPKKDETLAAEFSNYGKKNVDVFAPGVKVTSVNTDGEFSTEDGTSFASPITAGIAALILEYYPTLSSKQIKQAILGSAKPLTGVMVLKPGSKEEKVDFATLSKTGGVVNAYEALLLASKMKGERK